MSLPQSALVRATLACLCIGFVLGLAAGSLSPAFAACATGFQCSSGTCAPAGADCCGRFGRDRYCDPGSHCCPTGGCCPEDSICTKNGCLKRNSDRVCTDGSYCDAGYACIGGNKCLAVTSERYCGNRRYCDPGYRCTGNNKCEAIATIPSPTIPSPSPGSGTGPGPGSGSNSGIGSSPGRRAPISDACLVVEQTRVVTALGQCRKKNGAPSNWNFTTVKSSRATGCPASIEFTFLNPDTNQTEKYYTPFDVQICGSGPVAVETAK